MVSSSLSSFGFFRLRTLATILFTSLERRAPSVSGRDPITKRTPGALSTGKSWSTLPGLSPNAMLRDSRCRLARGYGSSQIPAAAQGAIQSNQIGGDRRLTLYELIFVCVKIALCIQHRQKIDETCFVLLGREIHGQLAVRYRFVQPVAALLFLRIAGQGVLDLFESVENCGLIADHGLPLARGLYGDVRTYAATSEQGQTDTRTNRKKVSCAQREIMELSGLTSRRPSEYKARK